MTGFPPLVEFAAVALSSVFVIVDPFAAIPTFLALTAGQGTPWRRRMAKQAAWTCYLVLTGFALAGSLIFRVFGITLPAFKIAGGLLLGTIAFDMLQARRSATQEVYEEQREAAEKEQVGTVPLGIPMLAGPGSIGAVIVLMGQAHAWPETAIVLAAIALTAAVSYVVLAAADRVGSVLSPTGLRIVVRLMGLVLAAVAVQFVINGLTDLRVIQPGP